MVCGVSFLADSWSSWGPVGVQFTLYIFYPPLVRIGIPIAAIGIPKRHQWTCGIPARRNLRHETLQKSEPPRTPTHETMPNRGLRHDSESQARRGRDSESQSARASQPRPRTQGQPLNNRGSHSPASAPAGKNHFSFVTIDAYQSRGGCCLPVLSGSIEQEHFTKIAVEFLDMTKNACVAKNLPLHPALAAILGSSRSSRAWSTRRR